MNEWMIFRNPQLGNKIGLLTTLWTCGLFFHFALLGPVGDSELMVLIQCYGKKEACEGGVLGRYHRPHCDFHPRLTPWSQTYPPFSR